MTFGSKCLTAYKRLNKYWKRQYSQPIVRRLTEHYKRTGRGFHLMVPRKKPACRWKTAEFIRFEISTQRLRYTSKGRHLLQNQNQFCFDICNAHNEGREWLREMCVDIQQPEWEERDGQRLRKESLSRVQCEPAVLSTSFIRQNAEVSSSDFWEKERLASEFQAVKAKIALTLEDHQCLLDYCPALRNEVARNSKCGEAVYQWCCDPDSPDCPLTERTSCTATMLHYSK